MDKKIIVFSGMPVSGKDTITKLLCEEEEGARDYLKIMSYIGIAHEQGYNAYEAIRNAISGNTDFIFFFLGVLNSYEKIKKRNVFILSIFMAVFTACSLYSEVNDIITGEQQNIWLFVTMLIIAVGAVIIDYWNK